MLHRSTFKLVVGFVCSVAPLAAHAQDVPAAVGPERLRQDWSRDVLRARAGESFAAAGDCGTAVDRGARVLDRAGRFATAVVTGRAVAPLPPMPASSDGVSFRARCGRMRVVNPRGLDAQYELDYRQDQVDAAGRSSAATGLPQGIRGTSGRVGVGGAAVVGVGAALFGSTSVPPTTSRRRGVVRWSVQPFMMGGGVGLNLIGWVF